MPTEYMMELGSEAASDPTTDGRDLLRLRSAATAEFRPNSAVAIVSERANNSMQALVNLSYLIAREARLESQLHPLVAQVQAELAQLSPNRPARQKE